ncbi:uncharacterized protein LOC127122725 [Lathyrus oleraceus]|uniref:uncharacterized protein LOC127122725 n=1 Tax=Pisum sativum TaxID=3888 RepID=UPI0021CE305A|nr:uncharacterized protein LOC127122725 [Pisum sativum]
MLGESSATKKKPVPLTSSSTPSGKISISKDLNTSGSRQLASSLPLPPPTLSAIVKTSSTTPTTHIHAPTEKSKSQQPTISLPTSSEPTPSIPIPSEPNPFNQAFPLEPTTSNPIPLRTIIPYPPLPLFNLQTTSIPHSEALMFNEPLSPTHSTTHNSPPYYDLTYDSEHSGSDYLDPTSPNLEDFQATHDSKRTPSVPANQPIPEPSEHELTLPTFDEVLAKFSESSASRFKKLSDESNTSENPSKVRTNSNIFIRWMTSEIFKMKGLFEQLRNDFIRGVKERLEDWLAKEAVEKAKREATKKAAKEIAEKVDTEAAAKEKAEQEAAKVAQKAAFDKATEFSLTQVESSIADLSPLVIRTLEELHKEQLVRARLNK